MPLQHGQVPFQNISIPLPGNQMPLQDDQVPLQDISNPMQDNQMRLTPEKNVRTAVPNPTLNPFIADIDDLASDTVEEKLPLPSVQTLLSNQTVAPPTCRPPLPPIPPRQRSFKSTEPIRIPIHLVRSNKNESTAKKPADADNNNACPVTSNGMQSKPVPEINETFKQNGNGYFNGAHKTIALNNHETPYSPCPKCPCKSGAHPKQATKCQENGYAQRVTPARNLGEFIEYLYLCHFGFIRIFRLFLPYTDRLPLPSNGEEVSVIPTHILSPDHVYIQLSEFISKFEDVQYNMLQKIRPKPLSYIPSK